MSVSVSDALSALGGDLTLSISFSIANELLGAAHEAQLQQAELVGIVLAVTVILSGLPNALRATKKEFNLACAVMRGTAPPKDDDPSQAAVGGLGAFFALFVRVAQRISATICVQLVAANVQATQPLRSVRLVTLLGVAVFFVFLECTTSPQTYGRRS
jgi:hypothetical protein